MMLPTMTEFLARARQADLRRDADRARLAPRVARRSPGLAGIRARLVGAHARLGASVTAEHRLDPTCDAP